MSSNINFEITARNAASGAIRSVNSDLGGLSGAATRAGIKMKAAFIGAGIAVAALTKFVVDSTKKAMAEEAVQKRLIAVMETRKMVTIETSKAIEEQVKKGRNLVFSSEAVRGSLAAAVPYAEDFNQALKIQNAAMDVAAAQKISLSKATTIVSRAYIGQGKSLAKLGIETTRIVEKEVKIARHSKEKGLYYEKQKKMVKETIKGQEMLDLVTGKLGGTAEKVALSTEKQFEKFHIIMDDMQQQLGGAFLPIAEKIARSLNDDILPKIEPIVRGATDFLTAEIPKFLTSIDPLVQGFVGPGGLVESITGLATAIWDNGNGPLASALSGLGGLFTSVVDGISDVMVGLGLIQKKAAKVSVLTGRDAWWAPDNVAKDIAYNTQLNQGSRDVASSDPNFGVNKFTPNLGGSVKLPGGIEASKKGIAFAAAAPIAALVLKMVTGGRVNLGVTGTASLAAGAYALGGTDPKKPDDALMNFAGGAGSLQALSFFLPMLLGGGGPGGGRRGQQPGMMPQQPGRFSSIRNALVPSFMRSPTAPGMPGMMPGMPGGAMSMNAQNVYITAANVMGGGMPGMMPGGMPMGPSPLEMLAGGGKSPGFFASRYGAGSAFAATRFGGAVNSLATRVGGSGVANAVRGGAGLISGVGSRIANSGAASMLSKVGGFAAKGFGALGGAVPIVGGIMSGLTAAAEGKGAGKSIGTGIGTAAGTAIGAGLLSWIPIAGPLLGGLLGGALGGAIGEGIGGAIEGALNPAMDKVDKITAASKMTLSGGSNVTNPLYRDQYGGGDAAINLQVNQPIKVESTLKIDGAVVAKVVDRYLGAGWRSAGANRSNLR